MIRSLHRWPGLIAAALLVILSLSGAVLSVLPASEALRTPSPVDLSVAALTERIAAVYPGVEQIRRAPSGRITAYYFDEGRPGAAVIDPATGKGVGTADTPAFERWVTNLHRSLFLGDAGRIVAAGGAAAMLVLSLSGVALVARRTGGWRQFVSPLKGPVSGRLHVEIARITVVGLFLSSATAIWLSASTFGLVPRGRAHRRSPSKSAAGPASRRPTCPSCATRRSRSSGS
jgi:sulfite reductase (NADPH) flavoprotein alpha-component